MSAPAPPPVPAPHDCTSSPRRPPLEDDDTSYSHSGTIHLSAFSSPLRIAHPNLAVSIIRPSTSQPLRPSTPRLIPVAQPLTPHPHYQPSPPDHRTGQFLRHRGSSPAPSSVGSMTVRPALLGSNQSTLKPLLPALLSPWRMGGGDINGDGGGKTWQETDSLTARQAERPRWIGSLGEVKMIDELEVEMCVLCGRAMGRSEVEIKEFELGGSAAGLRASGSSGGLGSGDRCVDNVQREAEESESVQQMMDGLGLGTGRWMICRDTASCDAAVENAVFADDENDG